MVNGRSKRQRNGVSMTYRITISGDKWPSDYVVEASGWPTAIARAVRKWKSANKGSRTSKLSIQAIKGVHND